MIQATKISPSLAVRSLLLSGALLFGGKALYANVTEFGMAPQVAPPASFSLKPQVEVETKRLYLGQIATCQGFRPICDEAYGVDLGPAPEPDRFMYITKHKLKEMLLREWPEAKIELLGPESIRLYGRFQEIDAQTIAAAMRSSLDALIGSSGDLKINLEKLSVIGGAKVAPVPYLLEFADLQAAEASDAYWLSHLFSGMHQLDVKVKSVDGLNNLGSIKILAAFQVSRRFPVAAHDLQDAAVITPSDLEFAFVPLKKFQQNYITTSAQLVGKRLKRAAPVGTPIAVNQIEQPLAVRRGDLLTMLLKRDGLSVSSQVKALGNGASGETIDAIYLKTRKTLRVKILDDHTVVPVI